eukprot:7219-Pyramimonas_sp.AAC.1
MAALRELVSPLSRSVDSLGTQLNLGIPETNRQIPGIQGQMLQVDHLFQMLQSAPADLAKATRESFESIRLIQEQALEQAIQHREIAEGEIMEDVNGMIQVMKDG